MVCISPHRQVVATIACASSLHLFATRWTLSPLMAPRSTPTARWWTARCIRTWRFESSPKQSRRFPICILRSLTEPSPFCSMTSASSCARLIRTFPMPSAFGSCPIPAQISSRRASFAMTVPLWTVRTCYSANLVSSLLLRLRVTRGSMPCSLVCRRPRVSRSSRSITALVATRSWRLATR